jgi:hypothetical protein
MTRISAILPSFGDVVRLWVYLPVTSLQTLGGLTHFSGQLAAAQKLLERSLQVCHNNVANSSIYDVNIRVSVQRFGPETGPKRLAALHLGATTPCAEQIGAECAPKISLTFGVLQKALFETYITTQIMANSTNLRSNLDHLILIELFQLHSEPSFTHTSISRIGPVPAIQY